MSLNGNLEDLPLLDILQIVSFSKKTGHLSIRADAGTGAIVFRDGFVVASFAWDAAPLDPRFANVGEADRTSVIRTRIEIALETLIRLREGQFSFSLSEEPPASVGGRDITLETLSQGINPQELLLDLARGIDEDRRDSQAAVEDSFAEATLPGRLDESPRKPGDPGTQPVPVIERGPQAAPPPAVEPPPAARPNATLLLVDDEEEVRRVLTFVLEDAGYKVAAAEDPEVAVKTASRLGKEGVPFILVTDLGMPTS
ncbi:MAG TPA: DUF4388 domain-containing protein, partial [Vicinamibacteria bacterium]|nr:DUF4388 domain-containing protein [Vicinamibacteria bacterium]